MNITYTNLNKAIAHIHSVKRDILAYKKSLGSISFAFSCD